MENLTKIKGVVFDMDGLMFDTEKLTYEIIKDTMLADGYEYDLDFYKTTVGKRSVDVESLYKLRFGKTFDYQEMKKKNMEKFWSCTEKNGIPHKKGLFKLLDYLKSNNIKIALATSTTTKSATEMLKRGKIFDYFDVLVCGDCVTKGKPDPEIFLKATQMLEVKPQECVGLEDSFNGIISSSDAGLITIMIPDLIPPTEEIKKRCYKIYNDLEEVLSLIKES